MDAQATRTTSQLPERGEPRHARCEVCGHEHSCFVAERRPTDGSSDEWRAFHVCLGCLMRATDPLAWASCADCATAR